GAHRLRIKTPGRSPPSGQGQIAGPARPCEIKGDSQMLQVVRLFEGAEMDKEKALEAAISQIERGFGKGSLMRLGQNQQGVEVESISTGSLGLDIALGIGGLPRGRVVEIYGPESSGKTTLAL